MNKILISAILVLTAATVSLAQPQPVKWTFQAEKTGEDGYTLSFLANVQPGWYIYSQFIGDDGPIPTSFTFDQDQPVELLGKTKEEGNRKEGFDELFGMNIVSFSGQARFTQRIRLTETTAAITGYLTFMTCDGERCLPPTDVDFSIPLPR